MEIIKTFPETLTKLDLYKLTRNTGNSMKDCEGVVICPVAWCFFKKEDPSDPEIIHNVLSIKDKSGEIYSTVSQTFSSEFETIVELCEGHEFEISVIKGITKKGREFVTCSLENVCE